MDLVKLTDIIVKELVLDKDNVSVKEFPSENDDEITIQVMVSEDEIGRVIGKNGNVAKALRCVVQASSYNDLNKKININIDSY